jgi:hypothetical protein
MGYPKLGEADPGGLGACPQQNSTLSGFLLFQKRSKSVSSAPQKVMGYPKLGEADPEGLGRVPSKTIRYKGLFFSRKKLSVHYFVCMCDNHRAAVPRIIL